MARARNIKPGFFENEALVECSFAARLCFIGLWTLADREGRLEDRPRKIKMSLFPDDDVKADDLLSELAEQGLIVRYQVGDMSLISIPKFTKHQRPHQNESASELPGPDSAMDEPACSHGAKDGEPRCKAVRPESPLLNDEPVTTTARSGQRHEYPPEFERMWATYPKRHGDNPKNRAFKAWNARLREGHTAEEMTEGVQRYSDWCDATGKTGHETVKQAATFFGPDKAFLEDWNARPERQRRTVV